MKPDTIKKKHLTSCHTVKSQKAYNRKVKLAGMLPTKKIIILLLEALMQSLLLIF